MATPDIKTGKYYNLKLLCILNTDKVIVFETPTGDHIPLRQCDLECVTPTSSEPPTLVGTTPKHDPCRLFRKGDKVRFKEYHGRKAVMYSGTNSWFNHPPICQNGILVVKEDEKDSRVKIGIITADCAHATTAPCYLELVTPAEEMEPYIILAMPDHYALYKEETELCIYWKNQHPHAKEAAEAERDRLNAEYRKEQTNENT